MNEKFFSLPEEQQQVILNAGYHVFSLNTYKNSPMSQIADAAGFLRSALSWHGGKACCYPPVSEAVYSRS